MFRSWCRLGTLIGGKKLHDCASLNEAKRLFESVYLDKTGNTFTGGKDFKKHANKFYPVDIDHGAVSFHKIIATFNLLGNKEIYTFHKRF